MQTHLNDRNEEMKSRVVLPNGHTLIDLHVGKRLYTVLSAGPDGLTYGHAARVQHTGQGLRFSPHPIRLTPTDMRELIHVPPTFLKRLVMLDDTRHALARHADALGVVGAGVLMALRTRVTACLEAVPGEGARHLSRQVRVLQHARTQAQTPGTLWAYNSAACVLLPFWSRKVRELEDLEVHRSFRLKPELLLTHARPLLPRGRS